MFEPFMLSNARMKIFNIFQQLSFVSSGVIKYGLDENIFVFVSV